MVTSPDHNPQDLAVLSKLIEVLDLDLPGIDSKALSFVSPEDVILLKLRWYSEGGQVSERQWRDTLGVLAIQGDVLDYGYLQRQAQALGLTPLLDRAIQESLSE